MSTVQPDRFPESRRTRSIVALLSSVVCSATAMALLTTVLRKQIFDLTGSSLDLGLLGLAEFAPAALLVFVTGTLAWYVGTDPTSTVPIFALVVAAAVALTFVQPMQRAAAHAADRPRAGLREALEGVRFVRAQPVLLGAISLDLFAVLFGGGGRAAPGDRRHAPRRAAVGIGAAGVTIFLAVRPVRRRVGRTLLIVVAIFGLGTIALGLTTNFVIAFIALAALWWTAFPALRDVDGFPVSVEDPFPSPAAGARPPDHP